MFGMVTVISTSGEESGSHSTPLLSNCRKPGTSQNHSIFSKGTVDRSKQTLRIRYRKRDLRHPAQSLSSSEVGEQREMRSLGEGHPDAESR